MTTTTAVPTVQFTEEEFNTIFGEISWELDILGDERRGGNEESAKDEEYLEEFAERVGSIEANKDGLYEVVMDQETQGTISEILPKAFDSYEENCDDPDYDYDPSHEKVLESIDQKISQ